MLKNDWINTRVFLDREPGNQRIEAGDFFVFTQNRLKRSLS